MRSQYCPESIAKSIMVILVTFGKQKKDVFMTNNARAYGTLVVMNGATFIYVTLDTATIPS